MRILFAAAFDPRFESLPDQIARTLRTMGHEVVTFDLGSRALSGPGGGAPKVGRLGLSRMNRSLVKSARRFVPDLVFVNRAPLITAETIRSIRSETGARAVNWWTDYPDPLREGVSLAAGGAYDLFYVAGTDAESLHHAAGVTATRWLPLGCDPSTHRPVSMDPAEKVRFGARVAFVGTARPERVELLEALADLGLGIWGPGWEELASDPKIGRAVRGGSLPPKEWARVYSAARIVVNISAGYGGPPEAYGSMANARIFETLACGACQVVDAKSDVLSLFEDGKHLVTFRSRSDLRLRVKSLLADSDRRLPVAREGRKEALNRHTLESRLRRVLEDLRPAAVQKAGGVA